MNPKHRYSSLVHTPAEAATELVEYYKGNKALLDSGLGITWGVKTIDSKTLPLLPTKVFLLMGRPGAGKSTAAAYLAKYTACRLAEIGDDSRCVVYITLEQPTEELEYYFQTSPDYTLTDLSWGKVPVEAVIAQSMHRATLPIFTVGHSLVRTQRMLEKKVRVVLPNLNTETIYGCIKSIEIEFGIRPALVIIDYIQKIALSSYRDRTAQVTEAIMQIKPLAISISAPILLLAQAKREVDNYETKCPGLPDAQWASGIEQEIDGGFGIWRPWITEPGKRNKTIQVNGTKYHCTKHLFFVKLFKQRGEDSGSVFPLHFDPAAVRLADLELRYADDYDF